MAKDYLVTFDDEALKIIEKLKAADSTSQDIRDVLRKALGLYDWALEQHENGFELGAFATGKPVHTISLFKK